MKILLTKLCLLTLSAASLSAGDWPAFRGNGTGVSADAAPPTKFSADEGVAWKAKLPGKGVSSPIVVNNRVIVTSSSGAKEDRLHTLCFDGNDGKLLWERQAWATGRTLTHESSAVAANTAASDGTRVFAFFSSNDLIAYDLDGQLLWFRGLAIDYPEAGNDVGMSSSVAVIDGVVVVQSESQGDSFALGLDAKTGETLWHIPRSKEAIWSSPTVAKMSDGKPLILMTNLSGITARDPRTGTERWTNVKECDGISSPVVSDNVAYVPGGGLRAIKFGDSEPEVLWSNAKLSAGAASPVVYKDRVFTINRAGVLSAADIKTGEVVWQLRLKGQFWATPVIAGDTMYVSAKDGNIQTIDLSGDKGKLIADNKLDGEVMATPAIANGALYVRVGKELWKIAAGK
jgi:outer membrane protein assembly factor BamB